VACMSSFRQRASLCSWVVLVLASGCNLLFGVDEGSLPLQDEAGSSGAPAGFEGMAGEADSGQQGASSGTGGTGGTGNAGVGGMSTGGAGIGGMSMGGTGTGGISIDYPNRFVVVVDRSGSMALGEGVTRISVAVSAISDFVALLSNESQLGLASFASANGGIPLGVGATKDFPAILGLQMINTDAERTTAQAAAHNLLSRAGGGTHIGAGLRKARDMLLEAGGTISINSSVFFLTDGISNEPWPDPSGDLEAALSELSDLHVPVFLSCIGEARDSTQCPLIADRTAGQFVDSATTESVHDAFVEFAAQAERKGMAQAQLNVPITQGQISAPLSVVIEPGTQQARFVMSWKNPQSDLDLQLVRPNGTFVSMDERILGTQEEFYRIDVPTAGTWFMRVAGTTVPGADNFSAHTILEHKEIHVDASLERSTIVWPNPFVVNASPSMLGQSIKNCQIQATVQKPDATFEMIQLRDDGKAGDGSANDGFYSAPYQNFTAGDGIYTFLAQVHCEQSNASVVNHAAPGIGEQLPFHLEVPTFERVVRFSGFVTGVPSSPPTIGHFEQHR
jgi:von Willebrand factor type A domain